MSKCNKCQGAMKTGIALVPTLVVSKDFFEEGNDMRGRTANNGPGKIRPCLKCEKCGWSVTL